MLTSQLARLGAVVSAAALVTLSITSPGAAARETVDPTTLNPAPPDFFGASCFREGGHISCTLAFTDPEIVDEPSGFVCGATELTYSQSRSVVGKRLYDAGGDLLQRHFREQFDGTLTNPVSGRSAVWTQHDTVLHNLSTPGDVGSGTIQFSGLGFKVSVPGRGTVLTDAGTTLVDAATDEVVRVSGHHPLDDYFRLGDASAISAICDAVA